MNPPAPRSPAMRTAITFLLSALAAGCGLSPQYDRVGPPGNVVGHIQSGASSGPRILGNGIRATEARPCEAFHTLRAGGSCQVQVAVGRAPGIELSGDANVLEHVVTDWEDGVLDVRLAPGSYELRQHLTLRATTPALERVELHGSSDTAVSGIDGARFEVTSSGSGLVKVAGRTEDVHVALHGSGKIDARELQCRAAKVSSHGSGDVELGALESLEVHLAGSGDVAYRGEPADLRTKVVGSGAVRAR